MSLTKAGLACVYGIRGGGGGGLWGRVRTAFSMHYEITQSSVHSHIIHQLEWLYENSVTATFSGQHESNMRNTLIFPLIFITAKSKGIYH